MTESKVSKAYYLLPIFLSFIGGLIMYFIVKDRNKAMARNGLLLGLSITVATFVIGYLAAAMMPISAPNESPLSLVSPFSLLQG